MTDLRDQPPLSRIELMVLARLSAPKAPTEADIAKALGDLGLPLARLALADCVTASLATLQGRALAAAVAPPSKPASATGKRSAPPRRAPISRFMLTDAGRTALRDAFELKAAPSWKDTCGSVVPALALGLAPGSKAALAALRSTEAMTALLLRRDPGLGEPLTLHQLCDQIIARALGLPPGPVTLAGIRAYALAMHCGVDQKGELADLAASFAPARTAKPGKSDAELKQRATDWAQRRMSAKVDTKPAMLRALQRHWIMQQAEADGAPRPPSWPATTRQPTADPQPPRNDPSSARPRNDSLLAAVRDAIPLIGATGRYGKENVFVSALWQQLARDRRISDLPLDRFKRWLVDANRDQLLDLARADLIDAMDARLVEESEIEDLGATFHFVIDRQALAPQVNDAR